MCYSNFHRKSQFIHIQIDKHQNNIMSKNKRQNKQRASNTSQHVARTLRWVTRVYELRLTIKRTSHILGDDRPLDWLKDVDLCDWIALVIHMKLSDRCACWQRPSPVSFIVNSPVRPFSISAPHSSLILSSKHMLSSLTSFAISR